MVRKKDVSDAFFDFAPVRLSTTSSLYAWIGLWTSNLLKFSMIYLECTGFLSPQHILARSLQKRVAPITASS